MRRLAISLRALGAVTTLVLTCTGAERCDVGVNLEHGVALSLVP